MKSYIWTFLLFGFAAKAAGTQCLTPKTRSVCSAQTGPEVSGGHLDTSGVFLSCNPESDFSGGNLATCQNLALTILSANTGATLNVIVNESLSRSNAALRETLLILSQAAKKDSQRLNVLRISRMPGDFVRDGALPFTNGLSSSAGLMPDSMGTSAGLREAIEQCADLRTEYVYSRSFSSMLEQWRYAPYLNAAPTNERLNTEVFIEGGNVLGLPAGYVLIGESETRKIPLYVERFFDAKKVIRVRLPDSVGVGHVDEFFNVVPSPQGLNNGCGFKILTASPRALSAWAVEAGAQVTSIFGENGGNQTWSQTIHGGRFPWLKHQRVIDEAKQKYGKI